MRVGRVAPADDIDLDHPPFGVPLVRVELHCTCVESATHRNDGPDRSVAADQPKKPGVHRVQTVSPRPEPVSLVLVIWRLPAESAPILKLTVP